MDISISIDALYGICIACVTALALKYLIQRKNTQ